MRKFICFCFQIQAVLGLTNYYVPLKKGKGLKKCKDCKKEHCNVKIIFLLQIIELSDYDSPATRKPRFLLEPRTVRKNVKKWNEYWKGKVRVCISGFRDQNTAKCTIRSVTSDPSHPGACFGSFQKTVKLFSNG